MNNEPLRNKRKKRIAETDAVEPPWGQRKVAVVEKWSLWGGGVIFFGGCEIFIQNILTLFVPIQRKSTERKIKINVALKGSSLVAFAVLVRYTVRQFDVRFWQLGRVSVAFDSAVLERWPVSTG